MRFTWLFTSGICLLAHTTGTLAQVENPVVADVTATEYFDGNATLLGHLALPEVVGSVPAIIIIP